MTFLGQQGSSPRGSLRGGREIRPAFVAEMPLASVCSSKIAILELKLTGVKTNKIHIPSFILLLPALDGTEATLVRRIPGYMLKGSSDGSEVQKHDPSGKKKIVSSCLNAGKTRGTPA